MANCPFGPTCRLMSTDQVVAKIEEPFPAAKNWTTWWKARAHLIIESAMKQAKPEAIMKLYPTTNNSIESFHSTFAHAAPRQHGPLYPGVPMAYHFRKEN